MTWVKKPKDYKEEESVSRDTTKEGKDGKDAKGKGKRRRGGKGKGKKEGKDDSKQEGAKYDSKWDSKTTKADADADKENVKPTTEKSATDAPKKNVWIGRNKAENRTDDTDKPAEKPTKSGKDHGGESKGKRGDKGDSKAGKGSKDKGKDCSIPEKMTFNRRRYDFNTYEATDADTEKEWRKDSLHSTGNKANGATMNGTATSPKESETANVNGTEKPLESPIATTKNTEEQSPSVSAATTMVGNSSCNTIDKNGTNRLSIGGTSLSDISLLADRIISNGIKSSSSPTTLQNGTLQNGLGLQNSALQNGLQNGTILANGNGTTMVANGTILPNGLNPNALEFNPNLNSLLGSIDMNSINSLASNLFLDGASLPSICNANNSTSNANTNLNGNNMEGAASGLNLPNLVLGMNLPNLGLPNLNHALSMPNGMPNLGANNSMINLNNVTKDLENMNLQNSLNIESQNLLNTLDLNPNKLGIDLMSSPPLPSKRNTNGTKSADLCAVNNGNNSSKFSQSACGSASKEFKDEFQNDEFGNEFNSNLENLDNILAECDSDSDSSFGDDDEFLFGNQNMGLVTPQVVNRQACFKPNNSATQSNYCPLSSNSAMSNSAMSHSANSAISTGLKSVDSRVDSRAVFGYNLDLDAYSESDDDDDSSPGEILRKITTDSVPPPPPPPISSSDDEFDDEFGTKFGSNVAVDLNENLDELVNADDHNGENETSKTMNSSNTSFYSSASLSEIYPLENQKEVLKMVQYFADDVSNREALVSDYMRLPVSHAREAIHHLLCIGGEDSRKSTETILVITALIQENIFARIDLKSSLDLFEKIYVSDLRLDNPKIDQFLTLVSDLVSGKQPDSPPGDDSHLLILQEEIKHTSPRLEIEDTHTTTNMLLTRTTSKTSNLSGASGFDALKERKSSNSSKDDAQKRRDSLFEGKEKRDSLGSIAFTDDGALPPKRNSLIDALIASGEPISREIMLLYRCIMVDHPELQKPLTNSLVWTTKSYTQIASNKKETSWRDHAAAQQNKKQKNINNTKGNNKGTKNSSTNANSVVAGSWKNKRATGIPEAANSEEENERKIKSLLNKLTYEKFDSVSDKLIDLISEVGDGVVPVLMSQVFCIATTQHHFIELYASFCMKIHAFLENKSQQEAVLEEVTACVKSALDVTAMEEEDQTLDAGSSIVVDPAMQKRKDSSSSSSSANEINGTSSEISTPDTMLGENLNITQQVKQVSPKSDDNASTADTCSRQPSPELLQSTESLNVPGTVVGTPNRTDRRETDDEKKDIISTIDDDKRKDTIGDEERKDTKDLNLKDSKKTSTKDTPEPDYSPLKDPLKDAKAPQQGGGAHFKRILLNQCQTSFELYQKPGQFDGLEGDELLEAEIKYKEKMLGNIKLVGELIRHKMIASRIAICICQDLLNSDVKAQIINLETLAAFLESTGPLLDKPSWQYWSHFDQTMENVKRLIGSKTVPPRIRCLLQDILDLRASGWVNTKKAKAKLEKATTLNEIRDPNSVDRRNSISMMTTTSAPNLGSAIAGLGGPSASYSAMVSGCSQPNLLLGPGGPPGGNLGCGTLILGTNLWRSDKPIVDGPLGQVEKALEGAFDRLEQESAKNTIDHLKKSIPTLSQTLASMYKKLVDSDPNLNGKALAARTVDLQGPEALMARFVRKIMLHKKPELREVFYRFLTLLTTSGIFGTSRKPEELFNRAFDVATLSDEEVNILEVELYPILDACLYSDESRIE